MNHPGLAVGIPASVRARYSRWQVVGWAGDRYFLDAAREAAEALAYGQLSSGGWSNSIDCKGRRLGYRYSGGNKRREGTSSLDDGQTQSAIQLVVLADESLGFKNRAIHQSALIALDDYWDMYTLNDNVCGYVLDALIEAHRVHQDERFLQSLRKLGDFLILAQMPDPQPGSTNVAAGSACTKGSVWLASPRCRLA